MNLPSSLENVVCVETSFWRLDIDWKVVYSKFWFKEVILKTKYFFFQVTLTIFLLINLIYPLYFLI